MKRRLGFTLVELLVVITIISLMISILLPALSGARASAQRVKCLAQQRQIFIAAVVYAGDHRGYFPNRETQADFTPDYYNYLGAGEYLTNTAVYLCPAAKPRIRKDWNGNDFEINIGFNYYLLYDWGKASGLTSQGWILRTIDTIVEPDKTMTVADGHERSMWPSWYHVVNPNINPAWEPAIDEHRHARGKIGPDGEVGLNLVYADGHGRTLSGSPAQTIVPTRGSRGRGALLWYGFEYKK